MPSDIPPPTAVNKKVPLWLWVMLVVICAAGVAFFSFLRSPPSAPVKEKLTPQQEEAIFSDIQEENFKVPGPKSSGEPLLSQKTGDEAGSYKENSKVPEPESSGESLLSQKTGDEAGTYSENKKMEKTIEDFAQSEKDSLIARGATPESAQEAVDDSINKGDFSKLNKLNRLLENKK